MKLLVYHWKDYLQDDISDVLKEMNILFDSFDWQFESKNHDEKFASWFLETIREGEYDALFSVNYFPILSEVCMKKKLKYLAWCYDNPLNVEQIEDTLNNAVNYVFFFDRIQCLEYARKGFETVYHLPLGVNRTRYTNLRISDAERKKYASEVSFVGKLYESLIHELMSPMNDYTRGYLKSLMDVQSQIYGHYILDDAISESLIEDINMQYLRLNPDTKFRINKPALLYAMSSEVTRNERLILLNLCGKRFETKFYSYNDSTVIKNVIKCGKVDYVTEMPKVFACSKVNLNPSFKMIQTGIPLRAFDIMGSGGFLLSNYQEELLEHYEDGTDMVIYESMGDAMEKIQFYLKNEELRSRIAENGRKRTLEAHSLQQGMAIIFDVAKVE